MQHGRSHPRTRFLHLGAIHHPCACMLGPHACSRGIPALGRSFSDESLIRGTRGSAPIAFSVRGLNNALSWWFRFVYVISTWKTKDRPKVPPVYPRLTRDGSLLVHVQHTSIGVIACNVDGHTRELGFPSRGNPPPLCMYSRATRMFPWHPGTRAVLFRRNPNPRDPRVYPRSILRTRVEQRTLLVV